MSYTYVVTDGVQTFTWDVQGEIIIEDPAIGVATQTITPNGGLSRLPILAPGIPGLPPVIDAVTQVNVGPDDVVPPPVLTPVSLGGPGVASHYTLKLYVQQGARGAADTTILDATDIAGTVTANYALVVNPAGTGIVFSPRKVGGIFTATGVGLLSTSGNASPRTLSSIAIPAQLNDWRPKVKGFSVIGNAPDTQVNLFATIGSPVGDQVGRGIGMAGSAVYPVGLDWAGWGGPLVGTTGGQYGKGLGVVPAGQACTVYMQARQVNSTLSAWTSSSTSTEFSVEVSPMP